MNIIKKYWILAKKSLGQNFLVNDKIVEEISDIIEVEWKNIVEVWPGYWALTEKLLNKKPSSLNLVELDKDMITILEDRKSNWDFNLENIDFNINNIDVLKYESEFKKYSVIANIPYYITSPILRHFLYNIENKPEKMVILMQKDVGDKILWKGKNKSSVLSLFIEKKCLVSEVLFVWKENFKPAPKIESSVLLFEVHDKYKDLNDDRFLKIIKAWFSEPRKKLIKNLVKWWINKDKLIEVFNELWIWESIRWEDLNIETWVQLFSRIS